CRPIMANHSGGQPPNGVDPPQLDAIQRSTMKNCAKMLKPINHNNENKRTPIKSVEYLHGEPQITWKASKSIFKQWRTINHAKEKEEELQVEDWCHFGRDEGLENPDFQGDIW
ncbi:hypothetical protein HAX54_031289, partial [Datura stramonium]|nr:hypothetical protein [Datura stramonium]